jgi:hypothetical protein
LTGFFGESRNEKHNENAEPGHSSECRDSAVVSNADALGPASLSLFVRREVYGVSLSNSGAANVNQKGQIMITRLLKRRIASDVAWSKISQALVAIAGCLILVLGFDWLADLELTQAQLLLGIGVLFSLWLQCGILYVLLDPKRRTA